MSGYVIHHGPLGGYIEKRDGMNIGHRDPRRATVFTDKQKAHDQRPGHHRDMGGHGFSGSVMAYDTALRWFEAEQARQSRWRR